MREYTLESDEHMRKQWPLIAEGLSKGFEGGKKVLMVLMRPKRNSLSSSKLHAMMGDINKQAVIQVMTIRVDLREMVFDECKALLVKWYDEERKLNGDPLSRPGKYVIDPLNGDKCYLRPSTKEMSQREACDFVEYLYALGASCGVKWSEKAIKAYEEYSQMNIAK